MKKNIQTYAIDDFTRYHDIAFIQYAYQTILKREADDKGREKYLQYLRSGTKTKPQILSLLRFSTEGVNAGTEISGLKKYYILNKLEALPLLGKVVKFIMFFILLPKRLQQMQQLEANNQRLLYSLEQIEQNFQLTSETLQTLAEIIDTRASDEDIKILYHLLHKKTTENKVP